MNFNELRQAEGSLTIPAIGTPIEVMHPAKRRERTAELLWASLGTFEFVAFGYLALSGAMILAFARNLRHPFTLVVGQGAVAALILLVCGVAARAERSEFPQPTSFAGRFWHFWRHWYPHLFFLFCFEELAYLVHVVNPRWQDAKLIAFDHWLLGVHPSVWLEPFAS